MVGPIRRLSHTYRFSSIPTLRRENVAEHCYYVSLVSLMIAEDLVKAGATVDFEKLYKKVVLHDIDESITGDFIRAFKYSTPELKAAIDTAADKKATELLQKLGLESSYPLWKDAKDETVEGQILSFVDLLTVITYILEEIHLGNHHVLPIVEETKVYLRELHKSDNAVLKKYGKTMCDVVEKSLTNVRDFNGFKWAEILSNLE